MAYANSDLTNDLDFLAAAYNALSTLFGDGSGATTISARFLARVTAFMDADDINAQAKMSAWYAKAAEELKIASTATGLSTQPSAIFQSIVAALRAQYGNLDSYLLSEALQIHPYAALVLQACGISSINPLNVFPLQQVLGDVTRGASTWGAWAAATPAVIDKLLYSPAQLELYVPTGITIGAADCTFSLTLTKVDASTGVHTGVVMPQNSAAGTVVDIGGSTDRYIGVTAVTPTGGTSGDKVGIRCKQLRALPW